MGRWVSDKEYWEDPEGETIDGWLAAEIKYAENSVGMNRSYGDRSSFGAAFAISRLQALRDIQNKLKELWGETKKAQER